MTTCRITEFGNVNVQTRATSRSAGSTYIVSDDPEVTSGQTITRAEYERIARAQDEYIAGREMIVVDGSIGNVEGFRTPARLTIERANANTAGMQQKLFYPGDDAEPEVEVIYTPNLPASGYP